MKMKQVGIVLLCLCLYATATRLQAQYQPGHWGAGVKVGFFPYDLDGTGTGVVFGPQAYLMLNKVFLAELSVTVFDHSRDVSLGAQRHPSAPACCCRSSVLEHKP
jgi:hypothetical protein